MLCELDVDGDSLHFRDSEDAYFSDTTTDSDEIRSVTILTFRREPAANSKLNVTESSQAKDGRSAVDPSSVQESHCIDVSNLKPDAGVCQKSGSLATDICDGYPVDKASEQCEISSPGRINCFSEFAADQLSFLVPDNAYDLPFLSDDDVSV